MLNVRQLERIEQHTSDYYFGEIDLFETPLCALRSGTRKVLSNLLDRKKLLLSDDGDFRDYRGLAIRAGVDNSHGALFETNSLENILHVWELKTLDEANLGKFQQYLGLIDRWDVIDDTNAMFYEDARIYHTAVFREQNKKMQVALVDERGVYNTDELYECLTNDDVKSIKYGLPLVTYDAFILYADEDIEFATTMILKLEMMNFKICSKDRDLLPGVQFKYEAIIHLITKRCNRMIVIVSPAFLRSYSNKFLFNYTQSLGIEQGRNKIIPCLYESCQLPDTLRFYFVLSFLRSGHLYDFWEKLRDALEYAALNGLRNNSNVLSMSVTNSRSRQAIQAAPFHRSNSSMSDSKEIDRKRKENLSKMRTKDRAIIQEINSTVQIHRSTSQVSLDHSKRFEDSSTTDINKIVAKLPSPPTESPVTKHKSFSMWDINKASPSMNSDQSESSLSKSQLNMNGDRSPVSENSPNILISSDSSPIKSPSSSAIRTPNWFKRMIKSKDIYRQQNGEEQTNQKVKKKKSSIFTKRKAEPAM